MSNDRDSARGRRWVWIVGFAVVTLAVSVYRGRFSPVGSGHPAVGRPLADLAFVPLSATEPISSQDWRGRVVLINFWATWCGPCRQEFPHLAQMYDRFAQHPEFQFVSVSYPSGSEDTSALASQTDRFLEQAGARFTTYTDPRGTNLSRVVTTAGLPSAGIPITVVLDRESIIQGVWQGYRPGDERDVEHLLSNLLQSAPQG